MGGRGASVGISKQGKKYGTEYKTLHKKVKLNMLHQLQEVQKRRWKRGVKVEFMRPLINMVI